MDKATNIVSNLKADAGRWTDAEIRLAIKALREVLDGRRERKAVEKAKKASAEKTPPYNAADIVRGLHG